jgi:hypothetical protein
MDSKLLMTFCAVFLGITGIILIFLPEETELFLNLGIIHPVVIQMLGALYLGFAMINWTAKANLIGGIYGRPITIGNFTHFFIGSITLIKFFLNDTGRLQIIFFLIIYSFFAIAFGYLLFMHPGLKRKENVN